MVSPHPLRKFSKYGSFMIHLYILKIKIKHGVSPTHRLSSILIEVFTTFLIQNKIDKLVVPGIFTSLCI
jgi:hypothetical protein